MGNYRKHFQYHDEQHQIMKYIRSLLLIYNHIGDISAVKCEYKQVICNCGFDVTKYEK